MWLLLQLSRPLHGAHSASPETSRTAALEASGPCDQPAIEVQPWVPRADSNAVSREVADLFHASVHAIDTGVYSVAQKAAWAPTPPDYEAWAERVCVKQPTLATVRGRLAGFMELDASGYIDCAYTHPQFQGRGVCSALLQAIERRASEAGVDCLRVDASEAAVGFFKRRGFRLSRRNVVRRHGVSLVNYRMLKPLAARTTTHDAGSGDARCARARASGEAPQGLRARGTPAE